MSLLLDEPLGALDKNLREQMQVEIKRIHREVGITMIYVTHDQTEAMTMSDRVAVFSNGRLEQVGTPLDVYHRPANRFVGGIHRRQQFLRRDASIRRVPAWSISPVSARCVSRPTTTAHGEVDVMIRPERLQPTAHG